LTCGEGACEEFGRFNATNLVGTAVAYTYSYLAQSNLLASVTDTASGWTQSKRPAGVPLGVADCGR
jgi:hypothetical protein